MNKILHIISSPKGTQSVTFKLGNAIIDKIKATNKENRVTTLNLVTDPFPHITVAHLEAFNTPADLRTPAQAAIAQRSDDAIQALRDADTIVISAPMHNLSVPSTLKAFIDHIVRAGVTFGFTGNQLEGLLKNKKAYIAFSAGWDFSQPELKPLDFSVPYIRAILEFVGISDVKEYRVEGQQTDLANVISKMAV